MRRAQTMILLLITAFLVGSLPAARTAYAALPNPTLRFTGEVNPDWSGYDPAWEAASDAARGTGLLQAMMVSLLRTEREKRFDAGLLEERPGHREGKGDRPGKGKKKGRGGTGGTKENPITDDPIGHDPITGGPIGGGLPGGPIGDPPNGPVAGGDPGGPAGGGDPGDKARDSGNPPELPEPRTALLIGVGLVTLLSFTRRK